MAFGICKPSFLVFVNLVFLLCTGISGVSVNRFSFLPLRIKPTICIFDKSVFYNAVGYCLHCEVPTVLARVQAEESQDGGVLC